MPASSTGATSRDRRCQDCLIDRAESQYNESLGPARNVSRRRGGCPTPAARFVLLKSAKDDLVLSQSLSAIALAASTLTSQLGVVCGPIGTLDSAARVCSMSPSFIGHRAVGSALRAYAQRHCLMNTRSTTPARRRPSKVQFYRRNSQIRALSLSTMPDAALLFTLQAIASTASRLRSLIRPARRSRASFPSLSLPRGPTRVIGSPWTPGAIL